ncbi:MAG: hypothetical protein II794_06770 [Oscillospiraceae bacterium]|nr:hypothetical protein [Oscillospiraceae bacterium]
MWGKRAVVGGVLAVAGAMIVLAVLLPTSLWWLIIGFAILCLGLYVMKKC